MSSTTPRLLPRWPPVVATVAMIVVADLGGELVELELRSGRGGRRGWSASAGSVGSVTRAVAPGRRALAAEWSLVGRSRRRLGSRRMVTCTYRECRTGRPFWHCESWPVCRGRERWPLARRRGLERPARCGIVHGTDHDDRTRGRHAARDLRRPASGRCGYDEARVSFNGLLDRRPAVIVPCRDHRRGRRGGPRRARRRAADRGPRRRAQRRRPQPPGRRARRVPRADARRSRSIPSGGSAMPAAARSGRTSMAATFAYDLAVPGGTFVDTGSAG